jgi:hypothetical protein
MVPSAVGTPLLKRFQGKGVLRANSKFDGFK